MLAVCSLLLKTLRSLLMGRVCSVLIAGLQLLSWDLKAKKRGRGVVSVSRCTVLHKALQAQCTGRAGRWLTMAGRYRHLCTVA